MLWLEGFDGAQHRAIIASRLGFFRTIVPDWVEAKADALFGADAPDDLGQVTVDLALQWSRTSRWLLERFPTQVRDAVSRATFEHLIGFQLTQNQLRYNATR